MIVVPQFNTNSTLTGFRVIFGMGINSGSSSTASNLQVGHTENCTNEQCIVIRRFCFDLSPFLQIPAILYWQARWDKMKMESPLYLNPCGGYTNENAKKLSDKALLLFEKASDVLRANDWMATTESIAMFFESYSCATYSYRVWAGRTRGKDSILHVYEFYKHVKAFVVFMVASHGDHPQIELFNFMVPEAHKCIVTMCTRDTLFGYEFLSELVEMSKNEGNRDMSDSINELMQRRFIQFPNNLYICINN